MIPETLLDAIADEARMLPGLRIDPRTLRQRDIALEPPGLWSPNRHCRLVEAADGWIAVNLARQEDRETVPAWLQCDVNGDPWQAIVEVARGRAASDLLDQGILLGMPLARVAEADGEEVLHHGGDGQTKPLSAFKVIDLSALWAGPLCGGLLAEAGMAVTKIESPSRPDPTPTSSPQHDKCLNGSKTRLTMPLDSAELADALASADILITSARPHALARLSLTPDILFLRNSNLIWVAITAYGFKGPGAKRVGFGDDCGAAGGLLCREGADPRFLGDALADPLTGLRAARLALDYAASGRSGLLDVALAPTAADFAEKAGLR